MEDTNKNHSITKDDNNEMDDNSDNDENKCKNNNKNLSQNSYDHSHLSNADIQKSSQQSDLNSKLDKHNISDFTQSQNMKCVTESNNCDSDDMLDISDIKVPAKVKQIDSPTIGKKKGRKTKLEIAEIEKLKKEELDQKSHDLKLKYN
eukprot:CAMPEP_0116903416 /NCGR_PEP_ID=MMETSP0467-20121206/10725_1 /TAXON_ID=283647 /ORGANISM="Mesodinium pulex, Strain SPMC105" /LENGTH=147 /DNA_ID=CAMNT_0004577695 /DNA_START=266 /DNA_END=709 /DNA_ORIENTATION=+